MNAHIRGTSQTVSGKTVEDIKSKLMQMLTIDGPSALTATTESGTEIHVELYEGKDYIRTANGQTIKK